MIRDFHLSDNPDDVGYYLGWMASSFCIAQFFTTIFWGSISDKFGRRPIILIGLLGTAITNALFGFSTNYKYALITRTLCGAVNANIGIIRSMVAEITNHSNHARAFSLLPLTMGVGTVAGPMLGALFVRPVDQFPGLFKWLNNPALTHFFQTYPYSLPCIMGSTFCLAGAIFGYFNLEETLPGKRAPDFEERFNIPRPVHSTVDETTGLLSTNKQSNYGNGVLNAAPVKESKSTYLAAITPDIQKVIFSYVLICCSAIMETELFALWTTSDVTSGGLGFNSKKLGTALTISGVGMMFMQVIVYPRLQRRFGTIPLFRTMLAVASVVIFSQGFIREFAQRQMYQALWTVLIIILFVKSATVSVMFTSSMILVAGHGANSNKRGFINGLAETLAAGVRGIGPALGGTAYSWALSAEYLPQWLRWQFVFILVSAICFANFIESWWIREPSTPKQPLNQVVIIAKTVEQEEASMAN
ncbi:major facilitator superfamily domain-containing protein [Umbelopsis sp. AD052]|nr:major facilitator superfamily domain-containing protein [Umbelopsis sp. AD052]